MKALDFLNLTFHISFAVSTMAFVYHIHCRLSLANSAVCITSYRPPACGVSMWSVVQSCRGVWGNMPPQFIANVPKAGLAYGTHDWLGSTANWPCIQTCLL
jgi:hypothetical protein